MYYVYIIKKKDDEKFYIGFTENMERRLREHNTKGGAKYTKDGEWELVYAEMYVDKKDAIIREKKLKHDGRSRFQLMKRLENSIKKLSRS